MFWMFHFFCWQEPNEEQTPRTKEIQLFLVEDVQFIFTIDILTLDSGSTLCDVLELEDFCANCDLFHGSLGIAGCD